MLPLPLSVTIESHLRHRSRPILAGPPSLWCTVLLLLLLLLLLLPFPLLAAPLAGRRDLWRNILERAREVSMRPVTKL